MLKGAATDDCIGRHWYAHLPASTHTSHHPHQWILLASCSHDFVWVRLVQDRLEEAAADAEVLRMLNYNFAWPYHQDLGLYVAVDGAASIGRSLPAAAIISTSPPGSFYSVRPAAWAGLAGCLAG